jgi:hypothetical protein
LVHSGQVLALAFHGHLWVLVLAPSPHLPGCGLGPRRSSRALQFSARCSSLAVTRWLSRACHRCTALSFCFCTKSTDMRERVLLFCLVGLVLTATLILVITPGTVTWALALIE